MTPLVSVIVPTAGQRMDGLARTLDSIDRQPESLAAEVIVVGDSHSGPLPNARRVVSGRGPRYRYQEHDGGFHMVGQPQRQHGMGLARAPWIVFSADDNILTEGAFAAIFRAIDALPEPVPLLFRAHTWQAGVVWRTEVLALGNLDADCAVVPNVPEKLGRWGDRYQGDWDFVESTVAKHDGAVRFVPDLISLARPTEAEDWTRRP